MTNGLNNILSQVLLLFRNILRKKPVEITLIIYVSVISFSKNLICFEILKTKK